MSKRALEMPRFKSEGEEADWWASPAGRAYVKRKSAAARREGVAAAGSRLVAELNEKKSVQIAIRLPGADLSEAAGSQSARGSATRRC